MGSVTPKKCSWCGKFISEKDFSNGANFIFTPDSSYTKEDVEINCIKCNSIKKEEE